MQAWRVRVNPSVGYRGRRLPAEPEMKGEAMKIAKYRNSKWLRKDDVEAMPQEQRKTVVERIAEEEVGDDMKPVLYLKGIEKAWPLNMTALEALADITGSDDTDDFAGTPVEIYVDPDVRYAGKRIGGIKLRSTGTQQKTDADKEGPSSDFDDVIPF